MFKFLNEFFGSFNILRPAGKYESLEERMKKKSVTIDLSNKKTEEVLKKPKKKKITEPKHNCEKDGHLYEIVNSTMIVDSLHNKIDKPTGNGKFFLECKQCKDKVLLKEVCRMPAFYWSHGSVSLKTFKRLNKKITELTDKMISDYKEKTKKPRKKTTKKKKVNNG